MWTIYCTCEIIKMLWIENFYFECHSTDLFTLLVLGFSSEKKRKHLFQQEKPPVRLCCPVLIKPFLSASVKLKKKPLIS